MQSYVARTFGSIIDPDTKEPVCIPLMDDLTISSDSFEKHVQHVKMVFGGSSDSGVGVQTNKGTV